MFISIGKVASILQVSKTTLRRWDNAKTFCANFKTIGGHRRYELKNVLIFSKQLVVNEVDKKTKISNHKPSAIIYARVSSSKQRKDLKRQKEHLQAYVDRQEWKLIKQYQDIGSGLNDNRKGLLQLLRDLPVLQPDKLVISYNDRFARFGITIIKTICSLFNIEIVCTQTNNQFIPLNQRLSEDIIAMLTSFAGKLHRSCRGKQTT